VQTLELPAVEESDLRIVWARLPAFQEQCAIPMPDPLRVELEKKMSPGADFDAVLRRCVLLEAVVGSVRNDSVFKAAATAPLNTFKEEVTAANA
jgi:hypothetical protein